MRFQRDADYTTVLAPLLLPSSSTYCTYADARSQYSVNEIRSRHCRPRIGKVLPRFDEVQADEDLLRLKGEQHRAIRALLVQGELNMLQILSE